VYYNSFEEKPFLFYGKRIGAGECIQNL